MENAENKGGNARSGMEMQGIWVEKRKMRGNQGGNAGNQNGNSGIAVAMTKTSNGNDKFKDWRKVKMIKNEPICRNLVSHIWSISFLVNYGHISHDVFLFILLLLNRQIPVGKAKQNGRSMWF